jgi:hypothetical protein
MLATVLASIGYNSNPNMTALRRLYDEDVTSVELFQKAVQLAPEKLLAATTTYCTYGEPLMVDAQERKKRGYIVRNAHGYILAYHLSTLPGSSAIDREQREDIWRSNRQRIAVEAVIRTAVLNLRDQ